MKRFFVVLALAVVVMGSLTSCATHSGSREYIPGKGWVYTD